MLRSCFFIGFFLVSHSCFSQNPDTTTYWHNKVRAIHYKPEGNDFVCVNGKRRFTRALYGTNTAFRVETGDLPEFAMYMPGMGGNIKFGLINGKQSKWLINAQNIKAIYRPGSMLYEIKDPMLGKGTLHITILALADAEGMIIKTEFINVDTKAELLLAYGGASGKKFSRDGDMGPDPESSFYLKPEYCSDNSYLINKNNFLLKYGTGVVAEWDPYVNKTFTSDTVKAVKIGKEQKMAGLVPPAMQLHVADAVEQSSPITLFQSAQSKSPLVTGKMNIRNNEPYFFALENVSSGNLPAYAETATLFNKAEIAREKIANRILIKTPDPYINTLGGALSIAADAVWESPTYMHGAIGWRMRLNGWRGPYVADDLGWHDRAKTHFSAYAKSQVTSPLTGPIVMDTALHLARSLEKMGTSIYSSGYICRNPNGDFQPHHYDMNLVYIDALLRHFKWTGDLKFAKEMWPVITRHLAWEKRNFDSDDDGLYDAYAAIWASDALQYSGGAVTHSSAYNYKANKEAATIAKLIGEDPGSYEAEAAKILKAINSTLWMPSKGSYAEFKDLLGNRLLHPNAAVWTLYHAIDSDAPDAFQAYESTRYIDENIPHIPVRAKGLEDGYYTISTSKWMPYDWSLNNVATAEVMHTALAYWEAGRNEKAFTLWKSELLSTMYLGGSPGNIGQISFYDAARGEAYRDFADPVAMTARSLVEGLFGIQPDALHKQLIIKPGFPAAWNNASIKTPDVAIDFIRIGNEDTYTIVPSFPLKMSLKLLLKANGSSIKLLSVNGKKEVFKNIDDVIEIPVIEINAGLKDKYLIKIVWNGSLTETAGYKQSYIKKGKLDLNFPGATIAKLFDPQHVLTSVNYSNDKLTAIIDADEGYHTAFVQLKQQDFKWWMPLNILVKDAVEIWSRQKQSPQFSITNNTSSILKVNEVVNPGRDAYSTSFLLDPESVFTAGIGAEGMVPGTNVVTFSWDDTMVRKNIIDWKVDGHKLAKSAQVLDISKFFNDKVTNIFKNQYLSPRPKVATLQLPTQGIGDWTHPLKTAEINDSGLRKLAGEMNRIVLPQGIPFTTPSDTLASNILFTSQWDNYPKEAVIPLTGKSSHAYFLMAGSTNPMQSRLVNGAVIISYTDNTADTLLLKNPETWWPIEQDYMDDGYAFTIDSPRPVRIHLKTGEISSVYNNNIEQYSGKMIEGGAATVLDLPLNPQKMLKELKLQAIANDVIIGLMSVTLLRN